MKTQEAIEFLERLLTSDPYSEDIFLPIPKKDFTKINELLNEEMGYPLDRLSGNIGRELYKSLKNSKEIREIIALLQQGEKYRQIVEDLTKETIDKKDIYCNWLRSDINRLKQKYFPKETNEKH
jgi:predicted transcriptional regulator